ncbi:MAG: IclR family transcriptional regulator [Rhodobacteraceae bacterium]|nr:IclR family transcriptional regulator [Paracoccaceae bacterium]
MTTEAPVGSIARARNVLGALASQPLGASLTEIMAQTEFTKTTTHRVLASLQAVNYVYQDPDTRKYHLGHALASLARMANRSDLAALAKRSMRRIADACEDTVFLSAPEGAASICVCRELGAFPIRVLTLDAGSRVPLGVGASGQALYAVTDKPKRRAAAKANVAWMAEYNYTPEKVEALAKDFHKRGYALNPSIPVPGMSAVGLPIVTRSGRICAAFGIGAINERMSTARIEGELIPLLRREVEVLSDKFTILDQEGLL